MNTHGLAKNLFDERFVGKTIRSACLAELCALKPGNISVYADGHGMQVEDFVRSADAISGVLTKPGLSVGQRIYCAIDATRKVVDFNTNLGIVLLCAPIAHAALLLRPGQSLRRVVEQVLADLDQRDTRLTYRAIRLAEPGGLGSVSAHDVTQEEPQIGLLQAMQAAAGRDRIAYQYANNYADVFETAVPRLRLSMKRWKSEEWAIVSTYLGLLSGINDTHVKRKQGAQAAKQLSADAVHLDAMLNACTNPWHMIDKLTLFDSNLKRKGINPGTTADLVVAALTVKRLQDRIKSAGPVLVRGREPAQVSVSLPFH